MSILYNRSTFPLHFEDLSLPRVPKCQRSWSPARRRRNESSGMGDERRNAYWDTNLVRCSRHQTGQSLLPGRKEGVTGRIKIGSLNFKVYNVIINKLKPSRNYFSDRCDRWKNIGSTSQCRRTTNCLDGVTLLQRATRLRQRDRLALVTGSIKVNDC